MPKRKEPCDAEVAKRVRALRLQRGLRGDTTEATIRELIAAADVTPGMADSLLMRSCWSRSTLSRAVIREGEMVMCITWSCSGLVNPGSTERSAWKVRIISPEPTSNTTASATCETTRTFCVR